MLREGGRPILPGSKRPLRSKGRHLLHGSRISHYRPDNKVRIELQGRASTATKPLSTIATHERTHAIKQWIGIDVSKDHLDIAVHPLGNSFRVIRNDAGQSELVHRLSVYEVEGIVLEATGGFERSVMSALESAGYPTRRVNPLQFRHFAKAAGKLAKTDRIDAAMIAHFGESLKPPVTLLPDAHTREFQALVTRRQ